MCIRDRYSNSPMTMIVTNEIAIRTDKMIVCMLNTVLFLLFVFFFPGGSVFGWGNAEFLFKHITEVICILISYFFCYLIAFFIGVEYQFFCSVHSVIRKISDKGLPCFLLKNRREVGIGYPKICLLYTSLLFLTRRSGH